jgi:hypothetical protein
MKVTYLYSLYHSIKVFQGIKVSGQLCTLFVFTLGGSIAGVHGLGGCFMFCIGIFITSLIVNRNSVVSEHYSEDINVKELLTNSVAPESEGSSPKSQHPATSPYPEPTETTLHPPPPTKSNLLNIYSNPFLPPPL